jgi:quinoprotein glucose dehydrogenase
MPDAARSEALAALSDWEHHSGRDRVTGLWRPVVGERSDQDAREALAPGLAELYRNAPDSVRISAMQVAEKLVVSKDQDLLVGVVKSENPSRVRAQALRTLAALKSPQLADAVAVGLLDSSEAVRREATRLQVQVKPNDATTQLADVLEKGSVGERQNALATLGTVKSDSADTMLAKALDELLAGKLAPELQLDLIEAAGKRSSPMIKEKLREYEAKWPKDDALAPYRVALQGGDAQAGRTVFFEKAEAACLRCHKVKGEGGEVGPELTGVGARHDRNYILESIVFPNKQIAQGFESVIITLNNGTAYAGIVKSENDKQIVLNSPEDGIVTIARADIKSRDRGLSAMPEGMGELLSKRELRDLVEFLATVK